MDLDAKALADCIAPLQAQDLSALEQFETLFSVVAKHLAADRARYLTVNNIGMRPAESMKKPNAARTANLIRLADMALYQAKQKGRNRVEVSVQTDNVFKRQATNTVASFQLQNIYAYSW